MLKVAASPQFIESVLSRFLHHYADRYPDVQVMLIEALGWSEIQTMLDRGDIHLGQNLAHAIQPTEQRFAVHPLAPVELLAAYRPPLELGTGGAAAIERLASHPLLLLDTGFVFRRTFDAACRLAGFEPRITFESRAPHTLLAMAECGHGVAVIPSALRTGGYALRITGLTYRRRPLREPLAIFSDKRRPLPRYAAAFSQMLADYVREVFPITTPTLEGETDGMPARPKRPPTER